MLIDLVNMSIPVET